MYLYKWHKKILQYNVTKLQNYFKFHLILLSFLIKVGVSKSLFFNSKICEIRNSAPSRHKNVATRPWPLVPRAFPIKKSRGRGKDASQTSFRLFECITSETKESCVSRTDALLVGTGDQVMEVSNEYRRSGTFGKLSDSRLIPKGLSH